MIKHHLPFHRDLSKGQQARHRAESGYKLLFAHAAMVRDLLRGFIPGAWVRELDLGALEALGDQLLFLAEGDAWLQAVRAIAENSAVDQEAAGGASTDGPSGYQGSLIVD